jgi:hypothetical protein
MFSPSVLGSAGDFYGGFIGALIAFAIFALLVQRGRHRRQEQRVEFIARGVGQSRRVCPSWLRALSPSDIKWEPPSQTTCRLGH